MLRGRPREQLQNDYGHGDAPFVWSWIGWDVYPKTALMRNAKEEYGGVNPKT